MDVDAPCGKEAVFCHPTNVKALSQTNCVFTRLLVINCDCQWRAVCNVRLSRMVNVICKCFLSPCFTAAFRPLPSNRRHLSCDDCLEDKSEDYQNCSVLYCVTQLCTVISTHIWTVLTCAVATTRDCLWFRFSLGFLYDFECFTYLGSVCFLCFWCILPTCFELSVPVQVIAWKTRLWNDLLCVERDVKLY